MALDPQVFWQLSQVLNPMKSGSLDLARCARRRGFFCSILLRDFDRPVPPADAGFVMETELSTFDPSVSPCSCSFSSCWVSISLCLVSTMCLLPPVSFQIQRFSFATVTIRSVIYADRGSIIVLKHE